MPTDAADKRQELLKRIFASRQFAHADSLKRILQYVCSHTSDDGAPLKEYDIAVNAINRPPAFDPKTDPIVRVSIAGIRERLRAYFETEGRNEPLRLAIPKGQYRAVFTRAEEAPRGPGPESSGTALRNFWQPHLASQPGNILVYTELLFFRDERGNFIRNVYVNDVATGAREIAAMLPRVEMQAFRPSYHFQSAGEVHCMLSLAKLFHEVGAPLDIRNSRFCSWNELRRSNLVLIGSARTNKFVDSLQSDQCFVMLPDRIENREPHPGEQSSYAGVRFLEGKLERVTEYAVVTRQQALTPEGVITTITANHGRAIEAAGLFVTLEDKVDGLLRRMNPDPQAPVPRRFQALLRVDMIDFDEEIVNVEYVTHRVLRQ